MKGLLTLVIATAFTFLGANATGVHAGTQAGVTHEATNAAPDTENVLDRVKETLFDRLGEEATGINVEVADGQVALSGCVDSEALHDRAARVAKDVEDVTRSTWTSWRSAS